MNGAVKLFGGETKKVRTSTMVILPQTAFRSLLGKVLMQYRELGTGIHVSEIGFGTWGLGGVTPGSTYGAIDDAAIEALEVAAAGYFRHIECLW